MQVDIPASSSADPAPVDASERAGLEAPGLQAFIFGLFFIFGGVTSLNDIVLPKLKGLFTLNQGEAMLVQTAFFGAYFLVSLPCAWLVARIGYMRSAVAGLLVMTLGCLLFAPAAATISFAPFLLALFVLGAGITLVQVVSNPLISLLGAPRTAHSRLTFAQFFNSVGTTVFPYVGAALILSNLPNPERYASAQALRGAETAVITRAYVGLAIFVALIALVVWTQRRKLNEAPRPAANPFRALTLLRRPRFALGVGCIFLYVGAEVAIGSLIVNYLMQADVMRLGAEAAGKHVPFYWGGAMVGRFVGAAILRRVSPGRVLAVACGAAIALLAAAGTAPGAAAGWALLAIGLFNSIMFPTVFTLASEDLGERAAEGSGVICMAIVGGAVIPPLTGWFADQAGLRLALIAPALCYVAILAFGLYAARTSRLADPA